MSDDQLRAWAIHENGADGKFKPSYQASVGDAVLRLLDEVEAMRLYLDLMVRHRIKGNAELVAIYEKHKNPLSMARLLYANAEGQRS